MKAMEQWKAITQEEEGKENSLLSFLTYLYDRWQDECEYEDINDYLQAIKRSIPNAYEIKAEPFGFKVKCDDGILVVWMSDDGDHIEFHAEINKE